MRDAWCVIRELVFNQTSHFSMNHTSSQPSRARPPLLSLGGGYQKAAEHAAPDLLPE
jgi:hypothetical protein